MTQSSNQSQCAVVDYGNSPNRNVFNLHFKKRKIHVSK